MFFLTLCCGVRGLAQEPAAQPAPPPALDEKLFVVPDGTPEELFQYIDKLDQSEPEASDFQTITAYRRRAYRAAIQAAEKILAAKPDAASAELAGDYKVSSLLMLHQMGEATAREEIERMIEQLAKDGKDGAARSIRRDLLQADLQRSMFLDATAMEKLANSVKTFVLQQPPTADDMTLAILAGDVLQRRQMYAKAAELASELGAHLAASDDPSIARLGKRFQNAARRAGAVGKPLELSGADLAGDSLAWDTYRGKVVLVIFWATWCPSCQAELETIRKAYDAYHARGFDVVAVSIDDDRATLEAFLAEKKYPWTTLFSADPEATGLDHPMAAHYGVMSFPTVILVGADGNVVGLDFRGPVLMRQLQSLLGPAEPAAPQDDR